MTFIVFAIVILTDLGWAGEAKAPPARAGPIWGWTSWDLSAITGSAVYGHQWLTADAVLNQSAALASSGLQAAGYVYINIDSFWASDPTVFVDEWGRWTPDLSRFPQGMRAIADAVHARGQRFGLYLNPGVCVAAVKQAKPILKGVDNCTAADIAVKPWVPANTFGDTYKVNWSHPCARPYVNSLAHLVAVEYEVDFLKIDAVSPGSDKSVNDFDNRADIAAWSAALEATGRDVWLAISWAIDPSFAADFAPFANSVRTSDDVVCYCPTYVNWPSVLRLFAQVRPWLPHTGHGPAQILPDLDSLDVAGGDLDGLTPPEKVAAATLWAVTAGPLYTGNDLTRLTPEGVALLTNPEVLAVNAAGVPAVPTAASGDLESPQVWAADFDNGTFVLALFNLGSRPAQVRAPFADFAGQLAGSTFKVRDLWARQDSGTATGSYISPTIPAHGAQLLRLEGVDSLIV